MHSVRLAFVLAALLLGPAGLFLCTAQTTGRVRTIEPKEGIANAPMSLRVELLGGETIDRVFLVSRSYGQGSFQATEMDLIANRASITLPSRAVQSPFLEYYLVFQRRDGKVETYPEGESLDPFSIPPARTLSIPVIGQEAGEVQVLFLSPDPSDLISPSEVVIAVSLLRTDSLVRRPVTQIFLDGADLTDRAVVDGDLIVLIPSNIGITLSPGQHRVGVRLFRQDGNLYRAAVHSFTVRGDPAYVYREPAADAIKTRLSVQAESRREVVASNQTWYNRAGFQFTGTRKEWRLLASAFLTTDERPSRQPQNRFYLGIASPWISAGYGDSYPAFPSLLLAGKRVRGFNSSVRLGTVNLDLTYGQTVREIEGNLISSFSSDSLAVEQQRYPNAPYAPINDSTWGRFSYGTYARNLFAIRPSFGSGETWQWGLSWLSSSDDMSSITYGTRPQENIVLGTDFIARFDQRRLEIFGQAAFSAYNSDISSGTFTDAYIDSTYPDQSETIKQVKDILSGIITVNDNLRPLSLSTPSTVAYEIGANINYLQNALTIQYLYRGSDYTSFGQTFLRTDIQGISATDRIRLRDNTVLVTLGFERLEDNTSNTKVATTVYTTFNAAVSYTATTNLPSFTLGYTLYANDNGLGNTGVDSLLAVDDLTNRFFLQSSYQLSYRGRHTLALTLSTSQRNDGTVRRTDVSSTMVSLGVSSRYAIPLVTVLEIAVNRNEYPGSTPDAPRVPLNYTSLALTGQYTFLRNVLMASLTLGPTFGDLERTVIDGQIEWYVRKAMSLTLQYTYFRNRSVEDDSFLSLRYRYDI
jgi:hypothetical protein